MTKLSFLCQLNGGCMGCCGHDFTSKEKIGQTIRKNTLEFQKLNPQTKEDLISFRDRAPIWDLPNGVCRNLIEKDHQFLCPLHPLQNAGKDFRKDHCDINYLCRTTKEFNTWDKTTQQRFIQFVKQKNLDNLDYSIQMDNNSLLKEFKSSQ